MFIFFHFFVDWKGAWHPNYGVPDKISNNRPKKTNDVSGRDFAIFSIYPPSADTLHIACTGIEFGHHYTYGAKPSAGSVPTTTLDCIFRIVFHFKWLQVCWSSDIIPINWREFVKCCGVSSVNSMWPSDSMLAVTWCWIIFNWTVNTNFNEIFTEVPFSSDLKMDFEMNVFLLYVGLFIKDIVLS